LLAALAAQWLIPLRSCGWRRPPRWIGSVVFAIALAAGRLGDR